jgi:hypothetical protein
MLLSSPIRIIHVGFLKGINFKQSRLCDIGIFTVTLSLLATVIARLLRRTEADDIVWRRISALIDKGHGAGDGQCFMGK